MNNGTKEIYYENQYITEFESAVTACEDIGDVFHVILEATAFYPEGGGQPADTGCLVPVSGKNPVRVLDVREKAGLILHITDAPLAVGGIVTGHIDWERRFSLMQHHTGEHIISGLALSLYGYNNVGFHMGGEFTTMDLDGVLTPEQVKGLELMANKAVYENTVVCSRHPGSDELARMEYRSKKALTGDIRIVTVDGYDNCACCGLHCAATGEIGVIKLVQAQKYKSGMRLYMLCGLRAVEDYYRKNSDIYALSQLFSARPAEVVAAARQCHAENAELKRQLAAYRFDALKSKAEGIPAGLSLSYMFEDGLTSDELRRLCMLLCEKSAAAAVFSGADGVFRYAVGSVGEDVRELGKRLNAELNGRGGGQKNLVQGTVNAGREAIEKWCMAEDSVSAK